VTPAELVVADARAFLFVLAFGAVIGGLTLLVALALRIRWPWWLLHRLEEAVTDPDPAQYEWAQRATPEPTRVRLVGGDDSGGEAA